MKNQIGIYSEKVECITYTLAYSIALADHNIYLITSNKLSEECRNNGHQCFLQRIKRIQGINVIDIDDYVNCDIYLDILYIEFAENYSRRPVINWCKKANSHAAICYFQNSYKSQLKQIIKYFPISLGFKNIGFLNGIPKFDFYQFLTKRYLIGFDVHAKFLEDEQLSNIMFSFDWQAQTPRKYKFNFLGNILPLERTKILNQIKSYLGLPQQIIDSTNHIHNLNFEFVWLEYGNMTPIEKGGLSTTDYINCLSNSDFTLCPLGYSKVTHRVVEALVRGSIPILNKDELHLYDMSLENGVNCIAVDKYNWNSSIDRILNIQENELIKMRSNILEMKDKYLLPTVFARRLRQKMGLEDV